MIQHHLVIMIAAMPVIPVIRLSSWARFCASSVKGPKSLVLKIEQFFGRPGLPLFPARVPGRRRSPSDAGRDGGCGHHLFRAC